jgi:nucleolar protein 58
MLVLFETSAGYALFKLLDKAVIANAASVHTNFSTPEAAAKTVKLAAFHKFQSTADGLAAATAICDSVLDKSLKKFLKKTFVDKLAKEKLAVADSKFGSLIKEKLGLKVVFDDSVNELMRGIRANLDSLVTGLSADDSAAMKLGLSHSLARYKLKFSPDKVDTMIVQAISLLDELDKELNTYAMRVREWYGWHFPEMGKIITEPLLYSRVVKVMGLRTNAKSTDLSDVLDEETEAKVREDAEVSMGSDIAEEDISNISQLCDQVVAIAEYRAELYEYLKNRMNAIAPNLTCMVGELVGARLIAHAGSLMSLAKQPASTVQILGAEKALFRALKTKHDTPKYGLIYHASLVGQAAPKNKGKISRVLAAKTALSVRMDALGDTEGVTIGLEGRAKVENRLRQLEGGAVRQLSGKGKSSAGAAKYEKPAAPVPTYNDAADVAMGDSKDKKKEKKAKKEKKRKLEEAAVEPEVKQKKKKRKTDTSETPAAEAEAPAKKKKSKKSKKA